MEPFELTTDNTGSYNFDLNPLTTYEIIVTRDGYLDQKISETTVGIEDNTDLIVDISLNQSSKTFDCQEFIMILGNGI